MTNQMTKKSLVDQFLEGLKDLSEDIEKLAKLVVKAVDEDPEFVSNVQEKNPAVSEALIMRFYRVGERKLHAELMFDETDVVRRLRRLPFPEQERVVQDGLPLLVPGEGKDWDMLNVDWRNASPRQCRQVVGPKGIRTQAEQRSWLADQQVKKTVKVDDPYRVVGDKLIVTQACQLTRKQILSLAAEMS